ncbi:MAG: serine hydrolase, partial [Patescibacteria group bacterium]
MAAINTSPSNLELASLSFSDLIETPNKLIKDPLMISPIIDARGVIAMDITTGEILYEKNSHKQLSMASITKLMTMLLILEDNNLNEVVTISHNAANTEGSTMFLREGEEITIQNLLYGTLIHSANDAAVALAEHNAGSVEKFLEKMNTRAQELKL